VSAGRRAKGFRNRVRLMRGQAIRLANGLRAGAQQVSSPRDRVVVLERLPQSAVGVSVIPAPQPSFELSTRRFGQTAHVERQARCGISRCSADASIAITSPSTCSGVELADHHRQGLRRVLEEPPEIGEWIVDVHFVRDARVRDRMRHVVAQIARPLAGP